MKIIANNKNSILNYQTRKIDYIIEYVIDFDDEDIKKNLQFKIEKYFQNYEKLIYLDKEKEIPIIRFIGKNYICENDYDVLCLERIIENLPFVEEL